MNELKYWTLYFFEGVGPEVLVMIAVALSISFSRDKLVHGLLRLTDLWQVVLARLRLQSVLWGRRKYPLSSSVLFAISNAEYARRRRNTDVAVFFYLEVLTYLLSQAVGITGKELSLPELLEKGRHSRVITDHQAEEISLLADARNRIARLREVRNETPQAIVDKAAAITKQLVDVHVKART